MYFDTIDQVKKQLAKEEDVLIDLVVKFWIEATQYYDDKEKAKFLLLSIWPVIGIKLTDAFVKAGHSEEEAEEKSSRMMDVIAKPILSGTDL